MGLFSNLIGRISSAFGGGAKQHNIWDDAIAHARAREDAGSGSQKQVTMIPQQSKKPEPPHYTNDAEESLQYKDWVTVQSSWILSLKYNYINTTGYMMTKSGRIYQFGGMSFVLFRNWIISASKGEFFNKHLKGKFTKWSHEPAIGEGIMSSRLRSAGHASYGQTTDAGKVIALQARQAAAEQASAAAVAAIERQFGARK